MPFGCAACSRNNIEAVNLANEGDQAKGTNLDEAISKYEQATQLDPTNHRILWKLALAYAKKEAWDKVAQTCSLAEKQAPDFANYWYMHGHALIEQAKKGSVELDGGEGAPPDDDQQGPELRRRVRGPRRGEPPLGRRAGGAPQLREGDRDEARQPLASTSRTPTS